MKRFVVAAVAAVSLGLVSAGKADAQIVYSYNTVPTGNGFVSNRTVANPYFGTSTTTFYSPFTGVRQTQMSGYNAFGATYNRSFGSNPWAGMRYNTGSFVQPNLLWGGYNYGMYNFGRRW